MVKVVVVIHGGSVTGVFSDDPHVSCEVIDIDSLENSGTPPDEIDNILYFATKDLTEI